MIVDLRSDTLTKPTKEMLDAMMAAEVGDDVYGEDPTVNQLEERTAHLLGKEAGLFTPSGTMANQIAINLHTEHGTSVVAEEDSHVFLYEAGAAAAQSGVQFDLIPFTEEFSDSAIDQKIKPEWMHYATTKLLIVENTHNRGAGRVLSPSELKRIAARARVYELKTHCDGARLWNAARALKCTEAELAGPFDTVSVCFSKGLGAPVGSVLVGSKDTMARGRKVRKRWGGAMRQAGYLAAAGIYALDHNRSRLDDDHRRVGLLAEGLRKLTYLGAPIKLDLPKLWTNLLYFEVNGLSGDTIISSLKTHGVLASHVGQNRIRLVTHLQVDDEGIHRTLGVLKRILL
ncbi:MAG: beta-eliminating lyase-related protein [Proteobacteria bacterium]|nr:beta-eliminating lyase-related protein [Pseudomonadota bacterium]